MPLIWSVLCVFLFVFHGKCQDKEIKERDDVTVTCDKENTGTIFWLRLKENGQGFEYIGSYSRSKSLGKAVDGAKFTVNAKEMIVRQFEQQKDTGSYGCVSINNNELQFSRTTKLRGVTVPATIKPKVPTSTTQTETFTTNAAAICGTNAKGKNSEKIDVLLGCELQIFISLVAACGLLLLILIITILYCNRIRTRRCPHHYKRQPRSRAAGHKTLPNPPDY